jgi:hypothetical protein
MPDARTALEVFYTCVSPDELFCQELDNYLSSCLQEGIQVIGNHTRRYYGGPSWFLFLGFAVRRSLLHIRIVNLPIPSGPLVTPLAFLIKTEEYRKRRIKEILCKRRERCVVPRKTRYAL